MVVEEALARRHVTISGTEAEAIGLVEASAGEAASSVVVTVTEEQLVYPEALLFAPSDTAIKEEGTGKASLFVNTGVIPIGSTISLGAESEDTDIVLASDELRVREEDVVYEEVARLRVEFLVGKKGSGRVHALSNSHNATLSIRVVEPKPDEPTLPHSRFKDWRFAKIKFQCFYDSEPRSPTRGVLLVSDSHPLNRMYFGETPTKESVSESLVASAYLAELLVNEALDYMFYEKSKQERKAGGNPLAEKDPHLYIRRYLQMKKAEIGPAFHSLFIDDRLLKQHAKETEKRLQEVPD